MTTGWRRIVVEIGHILAVLLITAACIVSVTKFVTPFLNNYRPRVEAFATEAVGMPVTIKFIQIRWDFLRPTLELSDVSLPDPFGQKSALKIARIRIRPAFWRSLLHWEIIPDRILVAGLTDTLVTSSKSPTLDLSLLKEYFFTKRPNIAVNLGLQDIAIHFIEPEKKLQRYLYIERFQGKFTLHKTADGDLDFRAKKLKFINQDVNAEGELSLLIPENGSPKMDLESNFTLVHARELTTYLPLEILDPDLVHWLQNAFIDGWMEAGHASLHGNLADFPFEKNTGIFKVSGDVNDLTLHAAPGWPDIQHIDGHLVFSGSKMTADIKTAEVMGARLHSVRAVIPDIGSNSVLDVSGVAQGKLSQGISFIEKSPLQKNIGRYFSGLKPEGIMQLILQFSMPLNKPDTTDVKGAMTLNNVTLGLSSGASQFREVKGTVNFTQDGLTAVSLNGQLMKTPITLLLSRSDKNTSLQGQLNLADNVIHLQLEDADGNFQIAISNPDFDGKIRIPQDGWQHGIGMVFSRLHISSSSDSQQINVDPAILPPILFAAENVSYDKMSLGKVSFLLQTGGKIQNLNVQSSLFALDGEGLWKNSGTELSGDLVTDHVEQLLAAASGSLSGIEIGKSEISFDFSWLGAPWEVALKNLNGAFSLDLGAGRVVKLDDSTSAKVGLGRVLSVFSLQSLPRRLSLDFSDLYEKGYNFDSLKGDFVLDHGNATTRNTRIRSVIARINVTGRVGLAKKDMNLTVTVIPQVTSTLSLPVAATIAAANPLAGIAAWIMVEKVAGGEVSKVITHNYSVTGSWANPQWTKKP